MRVGIFAVLASFLLVSPAFAGHGGAQPLDRIISHLRSERGGTFYDAQGPYSDAQGNIHYRIKWLTPEGRLIWLDTDAKTGRVLGVDGKGDRFGDDDRSNGNDYDQEPREMFPRDPRWPRWENGAPVGGWHDRGHGGGRWRDKDDDHHGHHRHD